MRRQLACCIVTLPIMAACLCAQENASELARQELTPKLVSIQGEVTVADALAMLSKQTGNSLVDSRRQPPDKKIKLDLAKTTFWPALEAIARAAGCGFSIYDNEGQGISLVDRPLGKATAAHHGIFRFTPRSVSLVRDEDTATKQCLLDIEVAWEPRCLPLYLSVGAVSATFAPDKNGKSLVIKLEARGRTPVLGKSAGEIKLALPAPDRSVPELAALEGSVKLLAPSKMVRFEFAGLKENQTIGKTQDEVKVSLTRVKTTADRWTIDVLIDNPKDGPVFESFQTYDWLFYNRVALEHKDGKTVWLSEPSDNEDVTPATAQRAHISYHFTKKSGAVPDKDDLVNWRLVYVTPGRIVEIQAPFVLKRIALP